MRNERESTDAAVSLESQRRVLRIVQHQRKPRVLRYIAIAGWRGAARLLIATLLAGAFGLAHVMQGDWRPLMYACVLPLVVSFVVHIPLLRCYDIARRVLNVLSLVLIVALVAQTVVSALQSAHVLAVLLGSLLTLVWVHFWMFSDGERFPPHF